MAAAEILASINSVYEQLSAVNNDVLTYRAELDALAGEDPCAAGFLDRLKALTDKATLYTQKRNELIGQSRQLEKDYNNLNFLEKLSGTANAAKDTIEKVKSLVTQTNSEARQYGGPAKRKALEEANAKCSTTEPAPNNTETPAGDATANATANTSSTTTSTDTNPTDARLAAGTQAAPINQVNDDASANTAESSSAAQASGTVTVTKQNSSEGEDSTTAIRSPKPNPLSSFSSYTYALTLYMVTPEAYNAFIRAGGSLTELKGKEDNGIYIVAQSGGINNEYERRLLTTSGKLGLGEPGYDYFIDDLTINTLLPGGSQRATVATEIKFKIIEPQSYNFLTDIARASSRLNETSKILKDSIKNGVEPNGFNQHYILGIKFYGYDINGKPVTGESPEVAGYNNQTGNFDKNAVINRYFAIKFTNVKFRLDGRAVNYNCETLVVGEQESYSQINATIKNTFTVSGGTVGDVLNSDITGTKGAKGLVQVVNEIIDQNKDRNLISIANKIKIEFLDENNKVTTDSPIAKSKLIDDETFTSVTAPMSPASTTKKVTIADTYKAVSIEKNKKDIPVTAGQNILHVIDNIIVKSAYITDSLKQTTTQDVEAESKDKPGISNLAWYTVNPLATVLSRDQTTNNWVYDITYQIKPYDIPYIRSNLPVSKSKFPGEHKLYEYLLTGKNTEIISYEQQYDNLYYMVASMTTNPDKSTQGNKGSVPIAVQAAPQNSDPTTGDQNLGSRLPDDIRAQLYSPGDQSQAKIKILGDPDYIMTTTGVVTSYAKKFYGKDSSINPQAGQVFIRVVFNTASDYGDNGLLDVSDKLQFYRTDRVAKAGIKGIIFMVVQVDSSFSRGVFTQTLDCLLVDESQLVTAPQEKDAYQILEDRRLSRPAASDAAAPSQAAPTQVQAQPATTNSANPPNAAPTTTNTEVRLPTKQQILGSAPGRTNAAAAAATAAGRPVVNNVPVQTNGSAGVNDDTKANSSKSRLEQTLGNLSDIVAP